VEDDEGRGGRTPSSKGNEDPFLKLNHVDPA